MTGESIFFFLIVLGIVLVFILECSYMELGGAVSDAEAEFLNDALEKIERTMEPKKLQILEEKRIELHWKFMDVLKRQGIKFKDRDHATRIAIRIAHEEL